MEIIEQAYQGLFIAAMLILALLILICILRSALGPRTADRIIAINMIGTMIIMIIAVLSVMLQQNYLVDICLIYAMISFLGVVVLCKIYTGVYLQKKGRKATQEAIAENIRAQQSKLYTCPPGTSSRKSNESLPQFNGSIRQSNENIPQFNGNIRQSNKSLPQPESCRNTETRKEDTGKKEGR